MTTNDASQQIAIYEQRILETHNGLKESARFVGSTAVEEASKTTMMKTLLPLILCLIGLIFFVGPWYIGIVLIAGGIFIAYKLHEPAKHEQTQIENLQKNLISSIDSNSSI